MKNTILVIDNDPKASSAISRTLEAEGYLVFSAASGDAGLTMAKKVSPMAIFLNLSTPKAGLELCKSLRAIKEVPIVLLTVRESKFDPRYRELYGITGFLQKPLTAEGIISALNTAIEAEAGFSQAPEEGYEEPAYAETQPASEEAVGFSGSQDFAEGIEEHTEEPQAIEEETPKFKSSEPHYHEEQEIPETEETELKTVQRKPAMTETAGRLLKPIAAVLGVVLLVVGAYFLWRLLAPSRMLGRRPAETVVSSLPSKPLKKPNPLAGPAPAALAMADTAVAAVKPPDVVVPPAQKEIPPTKAAPVAKGDIYYVQLGAFSSEKNAQSMQSELKAKGIDALIYEGKAGGRTIYRVAAARLTDRQAAYDMANKLKSDKKLVAVVTMEQSQAPKTLPKIELPKESKKQTDTGVFYVQLGAFGSEGNAQAFVSELKAKGLDASVYTGKAKGKTIYRVATAKLKSKSKAIEAANTIRSKNKIEAVVTKDTN